MSVSMQHWVVDCIWSSPGSFLCVAQVVWISSSPGFLVSSFVVGPALSFPLRDSGASVPLHTVGMMFLQNFWGFRPFGWLLFQGLFKSHSFDLLIALWCGLYCCTFADILALLHWILGMSADGFMIHLVIRFLVDSVLMHRDDKQLGSRSSISNLYCFFCNIARARSVIVTSGSIQTIDELKYSGFLLSNANKTRWLSELHIIFESPLSRGDKFPGTTNFLLLLQTNPILSLKSNLLLGCFLSILRTALVIWNIS